MIGVPRAQRFPIETRIMWRPRGAARWGDSMSVNASRSGVLFQCDVDPRIAIGAPVEFILGFSWEATTPIDMADVRCAGRIIRAHKPDSNVERALLAAAIDTYTFIALA